jgi:hypothetical protein
MGKDTTFVYVKDPDFAWVPATLDKTEGDKAYVTVPQYPNEQSIASDNGRAAKGSKELVVKLTDYEHKVLPLQNVDAKGKMVEHADMVQLPYLHEVSLISWVSCLFYQSLTGDDRVTVFARVFALY